MNLTLVLSNPKTLHYHLSLSFPIILSGRKEEKKGKRESEKEGERQREGEGRTEGKKERKERSPEGIFSYFL